MREGRRSTKHIAAPAEKPTSVWLPAFLFSESTHYNRQCCRADTGGFCDLTSACGFVAIPRCSGAEPGALHHDQRQCEISLCYGGAGFATAVGRYFGHQLVGFVWQRPTEPGGTG